MTLAITHSQAIEQITQVLADMITAIRELPGREFDPCIKILITAEQKTPDAPVSVTASLHSTLDWTSREYRATKGTPGADSQ